MELEKLIDIIRSGKNEEEEIRNVELLIERFPYFSTIRIVYLKMLHDSEHTVYKNKLKQNTVYIPNHKQFYRFLNDLLPWDSTPPEHLCREDHLAIELLEDNDEEKKTSNALTFYQLENEFPEEKFLPIEEIANEWRNRKKQTEHHKESLIDKFIETDPSMPKIRNSEAPKMNDSETESQNKLEFFSDTLAKIYIRQQLYDKAIVTYLKLSLKYPEKSIYFASQIEKIKEKINNNTN